VSLEEDELERRLPNTHDWQTMSPGEKQEWLLNQTLDYKRELFAMPLPDPGDDSIEANRMRSLLLSAADSTIGQAIQLKAIQSGTATSHRDAEMEKIFEERQRAALIEIERLRSGGENDRKH
jgi:hypothetical protein